MGVEACSLLTHAPYILKSQQFAIDQDRRGKVHPHRPRYFSDKARISALDRRRPIELADLNLPFRVDFAKCRQMAAICANATWSLARRPVSADTVL